MSETVVLVDPAHRAHDGSLGIHYPEVPARVDCIVEAVREAGFAVEEAHSDPGERVWGLHSKKMFDYIRQVCAAIPEGRATYPEVYPGRMARDPSGHPRSESFCFDLSTPLATKTPVAALASAGLALEAARRILSGTRSVYAICRPPGHHAGTDFFGGFCYLNNAALAADELSRSGKVAILDIDYHHGNGTQQVFYARGDVLYVSIHADPSYAYPGFSGFQDELGSGDGLGANFNIPLPDGVGDGEFLQALPAALNRIERFLPRHLVVSLGLDGAEGDPVGSWALSREAYERAGATVAQLNLPTLIVQEGGYSLDRLGDDVVAYLSGHGWA